MNSINFSLLNGLPMNQAVLGRLQTAFSIFNALGNIVGDKTIISGCEVTGANVSAGVVYVNGEVFEFKAGVISSTVIIKEDSTNLIFKDNNSYPVIKTRYVQFGSGVGQMNWSDFKRGFATKDIVAGLLGKADQTSFDALAAAFTLVYEKMLTIDVGAEKNVQADMAEIDPAKDSFVKNKTTGLTYLRKGTYAVGDIIENDVLKTVTFPTVGTNNYMVICSFVSNSSSYIKDNDFAFAIREKTNTSFKLTLREFALETQDLTLEYILIPL